MFDACPKFEMSPSVDPICFVWREDRQNPQLSLRMNGQFRDREDLEAWMKEATTVQLQDRTRQTITTTVKRLDTLFQDAE